MAIEDVRVVRVDFGDSPATVKELRAEIASLRDNLVKLDKSSDVYATTLGRLVQDEMKLSEVMTASKRKIEGAEGSYNHLQATMTELRKQWKATTDEVHRAALGQEINAINTQLKEFDATIGDNRRNVGSYTDALKDHRQKLKELRGELLQLEEGTDAYNAKLKEATALQQKMRDVTEQVNQASGDLGAQFSNLTGIASGVMGGFEAINGVMVLMGKSSESLEVVQTRLMGMMSVVQGLEALEDLPRRLGNAGMNLKSMASSALSFIKSPWGIALAAITAISGVVWKLTEGWREARREAREALDFQKAVAQDYATPIASLEELKRAYANVADTAKDKEQFLVDYAEVIKATGLDIKTVSDAEEVLVNNTERYAKAIRNRAMVDALRAKSVEETQKMLDRSIELDAQIAEKQEAKAKADSLPDGGAMLGRSSSVGLYFPSPISRSDYLADEIKSLTEQRNALTTEFEKNMADYTARIQEATKGMYDALGVNTEKPDTNTNDDTTNDDTTNDGKPKGGGIETEAGRVAGEAAARAARIFKDSEFESTLEQMTIDTNRFIALMQSVAEWDFSEVVDADSIRERWGFALTEDIAERHADEMLRINSELQDRLIADEEAAGRERYLAEKARQKDLRWLTYETSELIAAGLASFFKENTVAYKLFASAETAIAAWMSAAKAGAETPGPVWVRAAAFGSMLAMGLNAVRQIWASERGTQSKGDTQGSRYNPPSYSLAPVTYTQNVMDDTETDRVNDTGSDGAPYVLLSVVKRVGKKVEVRESESRF